MNIEFDVTLQCNFSCLNCNRHSNFNNLKAHSDKEKSVGLNLYENTDVTLNAVDKFIEDVKQNDGIDRIHLIGGEPLVHPQMDKIVTKIRDEIYGSHVEDILIISNIHPKMLKENTLDTPEEIIKYFPWDRFDKINLEHISGISRYILQVINHTMKEDNLTKEYVIENIDKLELNIDGQVGTLKSFMENNQENMQTKIRRKANGMFLVKYRKDPAFQKETKNGIHKLLVSIPRLYRWRMG